MSGSFSVLKDNKYPGRGIFLGRSACGEQDICAYFIMGRSENSRNRIFVEDGNGIKTKAFDPAKLTDPSLVIYSPVRVLEGHTIVTNGDQTDTIFAAMRLGGSFESALRTRRFEPDGPIFTPRISGLLCGGGEYCLSILKSADADGGACTRMFFEYEPQKGAGHLIHTYAGDGDPVPSFSGEPVRISLSDESISGFAQNLWDCLDSDNRVSLFVRFINRRDMSFETVIINKNK